MANESSHATARLPRIDEIHEGDSWEERVEFSPEILAAFTAVSGDSAPAHTSATHAAAMGFQGIVVHGLCVAMFYSRLLGMFLPGGNTVLHSLDLKMLAPVYVGDSLTYTVTVKRVIASVASVQLAMEAVNDAGTTVSRGSAMCVFRP